MDSRTSFSSISPHKRNYRRLYRLTCISIKIPSSRKNCCVQFSLNGKMDFCGGLNINEKKKGIAGHNENNGISTILTGYEYRWNLT